MRLSKTLIFFLIFTLVGALLAYRIIVRNYESWTAVRYDPFEDKK